MAMYAGADIDGAARELVARYGRRADKFAADWARELGRAGKIPDESRALLVLTAVEKLLARPAARPDPATISSCGHG